MIKMKMAFPYHSDTVFFLLMNKNTSVIMKAKTTATHGAGNVIGPRETQFNIHYPPPLELIYDYNQSLTLSMKNSLEFESALFRYIL